MTARQRELTDKMRQGYDFYAACMLCGFSPLDVEFVRFNRSWIRRQEKAFMDLKRLERELLRVDVG
jgi:hypothetical protein